MSYEYDSDIVILNQLGKESSQAKAQLFETYDQLRDLTVSGPTMGGSGLGPAGGFLFHLASLFGGGAFLPVMGNQSMNIPGTSYFSPIQAGVGVNPGGQSSFGLGPMSQIGFPISGSAAGFDATSILASYGIGSGYSIAGSAAGIGDGGGGYSVAGSAAGLGDGGSALGNLAATGAGVTTAATGFGSNFVLPAAGVVSGIGGLLTTLTPFFGGAAGLAGIAAGTALSGLSGSILSAYQSVSQRVLVNADTILTNKVKNIETVVKQLEAQEEVVKKMLKDNLDNDKKALQDLS
jgi:hypothetical protein